MVLYQAVDVVLTVAGLLLDVGLSVVLENVAVEAVVCVLVFEADLGVVGARVVVVAPAEAYCLFVAFADLEEHVGLVGAVSLQGESASDQEKG